MIEINLAANAPIDLGAKGTDEIIQNIRTIVTTIKGSVPLDREFGVEPSFMDQPMHLAKPLFTAEIIMQIRKYEPRVEVVQVLFQEDAQAGRLIPIIRITPKEGGTSL
ncbi:GPW/gp25 family protein [Paenibacillus sp. CGMCC 1.16610]|uniref:IraD/Gp25-like domain-containing protein n=1 Tax=Paenibacillus anseongense TaxID=2682845 RepID=A0ABW9U0T5_9BACL|nr:MULTISPECIES: GPW/gp25 family protein [Paenibacillus]MBA2943220.1 GPW/gp25 family protein [Paenibacillus sp. CGMCC 1.16610]MVQ33717.1 hypothetical protein [Paenibacillus anseongense]